MKVRRVGLNAYCDVGRIVFWVSFPGITRGATLGTRIHVLPSLTVQWRA